MTLSCGDFSQVAQGSAAPIPFFQAGNNLFLTPLDERISYVRERVLNEITSKNACANSLIAGIAGSLITKHPFPLFAGLGGCLSLARAQQPLGGEFQVNTYTTSDQKLPSVAGLKNGNFVVAWDSSGQDGDLFGVYGQLFDSTGSNVGSEFQVNTYTTLVQGGASVAALSSGNFVVAWHSIDQDGDSTGIYGQIFASTGTKIGSEFQVNTYTILGQVEPSIAGLSNGNFVVSWMSDGQDGNGYGIYGQLFDGAGVRVGSEFPINTYTAAEQGYPSVAGLSDSNFVVAWRSNGQDGDFYGVYGQVFNAIGSNIGSEFQVNTYTASDQLLPSVAGLSDGNFVVTWQSLRQDGDSYGVYGQRFNATGSNVGGEFQVNTYTTIDQTSPSVAALKNGHFVITWMSGGQDGDGNGIYGQLFDETGTKVGSEFQVNTYTTSAQVLPSVTALSDGNFVITWQSLSQDGDGDGIYGRIFDPSITVSSASTGTAGTTGGGPGTTSTTASTGTTGVLQTSSVPSTAQGTQTTSSVSSSGPTTTGALSSPSTSSQTISWLWPVLGAVGGVTCLGLTAGLLFKRRFQAQHKETSDQTELENIKLDPISEEKLGSSAHGSIVDAGHEAKYGNVASVNDSAKHADSQAIGINEYSKTPSITTKNEYSKTPSITTKNEYAKTPASVGKSSSEE